MCSFHAHIKILNATLIIFFKQEKENIDQLFD